MKWFTKILLVYIIALLVVPCSDAKNCEQVIMTSQDIAHFHNQDKEDNCTPFCECVCCSVSIAEFHFEQLEAVIPLPSVFSEKIVIRKYQITSKYAVSIWQPPKFSI